MVAQLRGSSVAARPRNRVTAKPSCAAGRPKDLIAVEILSAVREERERLR